MMLMDKMIDKIKSGKATSFDQIIEDISFIRDEMFKQYNQADDKDEFMNKRDFSQFLLIINRVILTLSNPGCGRKEAINALLLYKRETIELIRTISS